MERCWTIGDGMYVDSEIEGKVEELINERAEICQGMEDHDRVAVMDRACKDEAG